MVSNRAVLMFDMSSPRLYYPDRAQGALGGHVSVRFVEGLIVDAGITDGVGVTVVTASSRCAGRY